MNSFEYITAQTAESAVGLIGREGRFFAGGIDLLGEMKETLVAPTVLVNVKALPRTREISEGNGSWTIGANVTLTALAEHPRLRAALPALAEAAADVGSPQIRNVATVGGNLAQHSRCWYYRHRDVHCRKKGGETCYARGGENKYHSLFTQCRCLSPIVSNLAIALTVLDAKAVVQRGKKQESMSMAELYSAALRTPSAHNSLRQGDLILRIEIPATPERRSVYLQASEKSDFDWALVSCSAAAAVTGRTLSHVRLALGAVAPVPWQRDEAQAFLEGKPLDRDVAMHAAELLLHDASVYSKNGYKVPLAKALVCRALDKLVT